MESWTAIRQRTECVFMERQLYTIAGDFKSANLRTLGWLEGKCATDGAKLCVDTAGSPRACADGVFSTAQWFSAVPLLRVQLGNPHSRTPVASGLTDTSC